MSRRISGRGIAPRTEKGDKRRYIISAAVLVTGLALFASSQHDYDARKGYQSVGERDLALLRRHISSSLGNRPGSLRSALGAGKNQTVIVRVFVTVDKSGHPSIQNISAQCGSAPCMQHAGIAHWINLDGFKLNAPEKPYTFCVTTSLPSF